MSFIVPRHDYWHDPRHDCTYGILHTGDDPGGENSDGGDDEAIIIDINKIRVFFVTTLFFIFIFLI